MSDQKVTTSHMVDNNTNEVPRDTNEYEPDPKKPGIPLLGVGLSLLLALATFLSGLQIGSFAGKDSMSANLWSALFSKEVASSEATDLSEFWKVWNLLDNKYVDATSTPGVTLTPEQKIDGAISGLVKAYGDPYTIYMPAKDASMFEDEIAGNFSGVGMEVGMRNNSISVISPLPESPAEKAGILAGDIIVKIDGQSTDGMNIDQAVRLIRGEKGTKVELSIYREGEDEFREISIVRDTISIPTSKTETKGDVFVISLYSFNALSEREMQLALREFVTSGKKKLIIDLRGNPGGYLQSAVSIASYFLPLGEVVVRENFGGDTPEELYRSTGKELGKFSPEHVVVLVDGGSASASEILAGALQEHGVAKLIGAQTFGKGSVQELIPLDNGGSLKVTVARWLTPNGVSISNGGLTPDIVVDRTPEDRVAGKDPQLDAALEYLK